LTASISLADSFPFFDDLFGNAKHAHIAQQRREAELQKGLGRITQALANLKAINGRVDGMGIDIIRFVAEFYGYLIEFGIHVVLKGDHVLNHRSGRLYFDGPIGLDVRPGIGQISKGPQIHIPDPALI
jgi:hypothetical protein